MTSEQKSNKSARTPSVTSSDEDAYSDSFNVIEPPSQEMVGRKVED